MVNYVEIVHSGLSTTLEEFADLNLIKFNTDSTKGNIFTIDDLFSYENNNVRILNNYRPEDIYQYGNASKELLRAGTLIRIPLDNIDKEVIATQSSLVVANENYEAFLSEQIKQIVSDPRYKPLSRDSIDQKLGKTYRVYTNFNVWIWSKALGDDLGQGRVIDVTPFIQSVSVSVGDNGGNFQLSLAPVVGSYVEKDVDVSEVREYLGDAGFKDSIKKGSWEIDKGSASYYGFRGISNVVIRNSTFKTKKGSISKNNFLLHNIIQTNDIVFIQFEELEIEGDKRNKHKGELNIENLIIGIDKLPGRYYDLIGMVDTNSISDSSGNAEVNITVTGRDLMKTVLEDGEYFYTADFAGQTGGVTVDNSTINSGNNDLNRPIKRLIDGNLNFFNAYVDRTIEYSLKFVLNMLSNIEVCDNSLFKYYTDKVKRYAYADVNDKPNQNLETVDVAGIWQIIHLIIDESISKRRLVDSSIVSDQGSLINFIQGKIVHKPFAEFFGDTYGDKYYFIARKPPFSQESYNSNKKYAIDIDPSLIVSENLTFDDGEVFSWYRITPKGNFFGDDQSIALTYFPTIFFEEYARIWGSRPLVQVSNYIDYNGIKDQRGTLELDYLIDQARQDLAFLIETNAYRPFTRKGTITLAMGDRRIKRGQCIRHKGTGEVYHVDVVTHTGSISEGGVDRMTVLTISRGMVEKYMEDKDVNYFNIINLHKDLNGRSKSTNFKVNRDIFHFFMTRQQFK